MAAVARLIARLTHRIGRRGASLLFLALLDLVYAVSLLALPAETRNTPGFVFLVQLLPLGVWGAIWAGVGVLCLAQAFMRVDRSAFAAASSLKVAWGVVYLAGWAIGAIPRGYVSAAVWLAFAGFIQVIAGWRENWER